MYDVFSTTWESEVAALPNQNLAQHVLRIQHIAQERRFASQYPDLQRYIVVQDGEPAGRLYVHESASLLEVVDLTLMPRFRDHGIGTGIFHQLFEHATRERQAIALRVERRNERATMLYSQLGFDLVSVDDLDNYFEWTPAGVKEDRVDLAVKEDRVPLAVKEDASARAGDTSRS
ncbi:MAG TPA: GNAT family N-acetyltransferase [Nocardioidaceae bacterium]|nr:GNAT family N-acetyltransferase [Nocardioidaceae bacterium]